MACRLARSSFWVRVDKINQVGVAQAEPRVEQGHRHYRFEVVSGRLANNVLDFDVVELTEFAKLATKSLKLQNR